MDGDGLGKLRGWPILPRRAYPGARGSQLHGGRANSSYTTGSGVSTSRGAGGRGVDTDMSREEVYALTSMKSAQTRICR
jgi:hypothetical protein